MLPITIFPLFRTDANYGKNSRQIFTLAFNGR
jgi:hypothetical protein